MDDRTILRLTLEAESDDDKVALDLLLGGQCQYPDCAQPGEPYHQPTAYANERSNWVSLCAEHRAENDKEWADRWAEYYQGLI